MAIAAIPLIAGAWFLHSYAIRVSVPRTMKLADCASNITRFSFTVPKGHGYHLDLNTPGMQTVSNGLVKSAYDFHGSIRIFNGTSLVADLPIASDKAWLTPSGFVLTGAGQQNTAVPQLGQYLHPQRTYDVQITLDPRPPSLSFVELYWLQSRKDAE